MMQPSPISRRQFLKIIATGSAAASLALRFDQSWLEVLDLHQPEIVHRTGFLMGGVVTLTLVGDDPLQAESAATAAMREMQRLTGLFTRYEPSSQLCRLNAQGMLRSPDPALVALLEQAHALSQACQGAFDVSIKPLLDLYQGSRGKSLPNRDDIRAAMQRVNYRWVHIDSREIGFSQPGMSLTLDGIAKGAVIDGGVNTLRQHGFTDVIVEAGGDLRASGAHGPHTPWKIGLRQPRQDETIQLPALQVRNLAVATSGDYLQSFVADYSVHHILDPRQGISPMELSSATVIAPSAVLADALATGIMVVGKQAGLEMLKHFPGCEAYLITKDLQVVSSAGMASFLV